MRPAPTSGQRLTRDLEVVVPAQLVVPHRVRVRAVGGVPVRRVVEAVVLEQPVEIRQPLALGRHPVGDLAVPAREEGGAGDRRQTLAERAVAGAEVPLPVARIVDVRLEDVHRHARAEASRSEQGVESAADVRAHLRARGRVRAQKDRRQLGLHVVATAGDADGDRTRQRGGQAFDLARERAGLRSALRVVLVRERRILLLQILLEQVVVKWSLTAAVADRIAEHHQ